MRLTDKPINVFVIGDLVLDHAIFVRQKDKAHQKVGTERVFEVEHRLNTAGGAANCARILAAVSKGMTFLWGAVGRSPWGTFPAVLEACQHLDAATNSVIFRGLHDEAARNNTITRVIVVGDNENETHVMRFDDVGHVQMSEPLVNRAWEAVTDEHKNRKIGAILVNDLNMGAITSALVTRISCFAKDKDNDIALFVDPKRDIDKYSEVNATAVMPNLAEWCHIIGDPDATDHWRLALSIAQNLREMALRSLLRMPNFVHHLIKCDKDGALLLCPNDDNPHEYEVHHFLPHPTDYPRERLKPQLGYGDVMGAIIALEYAAESTQKRLGVRIRNAFLRANAVVAAYRQKPYCRMPNRTEVEVLAATAGDAVSLKLLVMAGVRYLPRSTTIQLRDFRTEVAALVSTNEAYKSVISRLLEFFENGWGNGDMRSAILTARGGSGKSELAQGLEDKLAPYKISVIDIEGRLPAGSGWGGLEEITKLLDMIGDENEGQAGTILIMDEAFKKGIQFLRDGNGVVLLDKARTRKVRLLLIDADASDYFDQLAGSQFVSRCEVFRLPEISERPCDIPLILAKMIYAQAGSRDLACVWIKRSVLVSVVDWLLSREPRLRSVRSLSDKAKELCKAVEQEGKNTRVLEVQTNHLPNDLRKFAWPQGELDVFYQFFPG